MRTKLLLITVFLSYCVSTSATTVKFNDIDNIPNGNFPTLSSTLIGADTTATTTTSSSSTTTTSSSTSGTHCPYEPVCGENNITYSSSCQATRAGTTAKFKGVCEGSFCESPDSSRVYAFGQSYYDGCNTCHCSICDEKVCYMACTQMACTSASKTAMIAFVTSLVVVLFLLAVFCLCCWKRCKGKQEDGGHGFTGSYDEREGITHRQVNNIEEQTTSVV